MDDQHGESISGGDGRRRSAKYRRREQEIINVGGEVFAEKGYMAATLDDVAARVGMLKGSLYYYIDSKEDLLYKITMYIHREANEILVDALTRSDDPLERLNAIVDAHFRTLAMKTRMTGVFYSEFRHIEGERRKETMRLRRHYEDRVHDVLRAAQDVGEICRRRDARIQSIALLTLLNSVHTWFDPNGRVDLDEVADIYREFVVNGLRCDHEDCARPAISERSTDDNHKENGEP